MADTDRMSFLPTIKCSNCSVAIQISQLADHVCTTSSPEDNGLSSPRLDRAATFGGSSFADKRSSQNRPSRLPPPRINPSAANNPFRPQDQLSPLSDYSNPKSRSPLSPTHRRVPFKMNRSATSPMPRGKRPPSPDLPSNMDCAFPPFPTSRSATPTSAKPKSKDRLDTGYKHRYAEADPLYAPLSPRTNGGQNVLKRMNTIAPGPFDGRGDSRPSTSDGRKTPVDRTPGMGHRRTGTQSSTKSNGLGGKQRTSLASTVSRSSTVSNRSVGLPARPKPGMTAIPPPPPPPPPAEPQAEGIDAFLDRLQKETMQPLKMSQDRSRTFPLRQESREAGGAAPRQGRPLESNGLSRRPTDLESFASAPRSNNLFPARSSSRAGSKPSVRPNDAPPVPPMPDYGKELPPNPLHTPSDSGHSDDSISTGGFRSATSSRSSPPASETSGQHSRNASKMGRTDILDDEPIPRTASPESFMDPRAPPRPEKRKEPAGLDRGRAPEPLPQLPSISFSDAPQSPLDPAIHVGLLHKKRPSGSQNLLRDGPIVNTRQSPPRTSPGLNSQNVSTSSVGRSPPRLSPGPESRDDPALNLGRVAPPPMPDMEPRERPLARRVTTASRGKCRGCSESIVGKSVKDSSGRLTGRYHKQCFVCRTCRDPFPSAEFYVFENSPYCEQHYHELNGSLCKSCDRGIEGQFLETDQRQKFHPRCFTCLTCRVVLRDDYYEVAGKTYCERHAYATQKGNNSLFPGDNRLRTNNLQKRRTRLMIMM